MGNKLFVGGLKWEATEDDLREFFAEAGEITDAVVLHDRDTGRSRGFGFVTYATDEEAKAAVEKFNEADFMGRKLTVNEACLLYTSPSPRDVEESRMPSSA